ncbi:MAG: peptidoglycan-binding protein [Coriobacteriia bacterium]|nr:peptidoglycan-binding protein [Coriobacteriia bacterium]
MRAVRPSDRGPAVEDIQRRLLALGYDLGPTGVDGVFLGKTADAVRVFQQERHLAEDSVVGESTWAALVDAGFTLGDRMLYLRLPHFHGNDVLTLQCALNVLGFACGQADGIFGTFCERAVREYQRNVGLPADGIVGPETSNTLLNLRHVWEGKDSGAHSAARTKPARIADVLKRVHLIVLGDDASGARVARRLVNLAQASEPEALIRFGIEGEQPPAKTVVFHLLGCGTTPACGKPVVRMDGAVALSSRLFTALSSVRSGCPDLVVELGDTGEDEERKDQRAAVLLLDAICLAFDRDPSGW